MSTQSHDRAPGDDTSLAPTREEMLSEFLVYTIGLVLAVILTAVCSVLNSGLYSAARMFAALAAGQIDAAMTDTAIVLGQAAASNGAMVVPGQYHTGEVYGALYPKGSANEATLDKIIKALEDDGTLAQLSAKYLAAAWGADPTKIPYFEP